MIDYKVVHYGDFNKFIIDYDFDIEEELPKLEVVTGSIDDYMKSIAESKDYEELLGENIVNRNAIILKPKKPFIDWVNKVDQDEEIFMFETKIYLVDEEEDPEVWLEDNFYDLFEKELEGGTIDEDLWPQNISFKLFKKWFKVDFSIMVYDMENGEISKKII
jgi:hypothetical protein